MRRLLILPTLFLVMLGAPVFATESGQAPPATVDELPVTAAAEAVAPGWQSPETPVPGAEMLGVTWQGDPNAVFNVEVQNEDGAWQAAEPLGSDDTGTDGGTSDATQAASVQGTGNATEPIWAPDAAAVRVTLESGDATDVAVAAVNADGVSAPSGAAGAASGILAPLDGPDRYAFAAVLLAVAVLLGAVALGWSPWRRRSRRRTLLLLALGSLVLVACVPPRPPAPPGDGGTQPAITPRSAWGARGFSCAGGPVSAPALKFAVVHHTAGSNNYGPGDTPSILRGIQAYHMDALGYCDIAYNFLIDKYGQIFEGRDGGITNPIIGGHSGGFNTASVGVALVGDLTGASAPAAEWNSLVSLLRWRLSVAGINPSAGFTTTAASSPCNCVRWGPGTIVSFPSAIVGHRDLDTTSCPGNAFYPNLPALRDQVQSGIVPPTTTTSSTTTTSTT